jgi:uncharacterized protein (DUF302 family)
MEEMFRLIKSKGFKIFSKFDFKRILINAKEIVKILHDKNGDE